MKEDWQLPAVQFRQQFAELVGGFGVDLALRGDPFTAARPARVSFAMGQIKSDWDLRRRVMGNRRGRGSFGQGIRRDDHRVQSDASEHGKNDRQFVGSRHGGHLIARGRISITQPRGEHTS